MGTTQSGIEDVTFKEQSFELQPKSEKQVEVVYSPFVATEGEKTGEIKLLSDELGTYPYTVLYKAGPASLERTVMLKAPLGQEVVETFRFLHTARVGCMYKGEVRAWLQGGHKEQEKNDFVIETKEVKADAWG